MKMSKKTLALLAAMVLAIGVAAGSTLAWLTDTTGDVVNTFTTSDVDIELTESDADKDKDPMANAYKMVPGYTIDKDPTVTVKADSEKCWLFVRLEKSPNFDDFMEYEMAEGWEELTGVDDVYYRETPVEKSSADQEFQVIKGDKVTVKGSVTKAMMNAIDDGTATKPTLTVTAYASQYMKNNTESFTEVEAWGNVNPAVTAP